jgi:hypothetical protein
MFPLCSDCADNLNQGNCTHTDEERCIVGKWVEDEVRKAIEMGYISVNVFEFLEYEITCFVEVPIQEASLQSMLICSSN